MSTKEAIKWLKAIKEKYIHGGDEEFDNKRNEAMDFAIKALMAYRDCGHCKHKIKVGNMYGCELWDCDFEKTEVQHDSL